MKPQWARHDLPYYDEVPSVYAAMCKPQPGEPRPCAEAQAASDTLDVVVEFLNREVAAVVRESSLPGASRTKDGDWVVFGNDNIYDAGMTAVEARTRAIEHRSLVAEYESLARAIESE
jgi:hypothetical protein